MSTIKLTVNGKAVSADVEDRTLLVHLLRETLNLTGTHVGCDTSQCGACVVHIDGKAVKNLPQAMGKPGHNTPEGTYTVMSEHTNYTMDSSTYGVPVDAAEGYRTTVEIAVRRLVIPRSGRRSQASRTDSMLSIGSPIPMKTQ